MRALVFKGAGSLAVEEIEDPTPAVGELLVKPLFTGICGSDVHGTAGETGRRKPGQVMGHEVVARVVDPNECPGVEQDDLVTFNPVISSPDDPEEYKTRPDLSPTRTVIGVDAPYTGGFAELMVIPERALIVLPRNIEPESAAFIEPLAVGIHAASRAGIAENDTVAVLGAGMIGLVSAWAALRAGASRVIVTDFDERKLEVARSLGAITVHASERLADYLPDLLGSAQVDRVIDSVGLNQTLATALEVSRRHGTIAMVGLGAPMLELPAFALAVEERNMVGCFCYSPSHFDEAARYVVADEFPWRKFFDRSVSLDEAADAFAGISDNSAPSIKTLVALDAQ